jgi:hypothetical protein
MAHFRPQAWVNDCAVDIDGGFDFDCTRALLAQDAKTLRNFKFNSYDTDNLYRDSDVPQEHTGPFEVDVSEDDFGSFFAAHGGGRSLDDLCANLGSPEQRMSCWQPSISMTP